MNWLSGPLFARVLRYSGRSRPRAREQTLASHNILSAPLVIQPWAAEDGLDTFEERISSAPTYLGILDMQAG